jgi:hypothetical protein
MNAKKKQQISAATRTAVQRAERQQRAPGKRQMQATLLPPEEDQEWLVVEGMEEAKVNMHTPAKAKHTGGRVQALATTGHALEPGDEEEQALFEAGVYTLRDMIAPTSVEVSKDYMCVDGRYYCYFMIVGLPRRLRAGWVEHITRLKLPMQISFHFSPFSPLTIMKHLELQLNQIESKRMLDFQGGRLEKMGESIGADDIRRILYGIEEGTVRVFSMSLTIGLHASSLQKLDQRAHFLVTNLRQYQLHVREALLQEDLAWRTCTPGPDLLCRRTNLDNASLAMCMPFTSSTIGTGDGAFLGISPSGDPMFFNPWSTKKKLPNGSIVICGESGQGKSYLTKKLALGLMSTSNVDCVVIDRDGDYDPLCEALGEGESQRINLAHGCPINPFDLPFTPEDVEQGEGQDFLSEHIDNSLLSFLGMVLADTRLSKQEEAVLFQALVKTYAKVGITNEGILRDPETLSRPAPLISDLAQTLEEMPQAAPFSFTERLEKVSYLFRDSTTLSLEKPLTVFSIKDLDESHYPFMIYAVKNFLNRNRALLRYKRFLLFLIEEASFILRHPHGRKYLEQSSRGVRKYGIAQVTISQHPNDFLRDGEVIVANAGTCFFLGMDQSAVEKLSLTPQLERVLLQARPGECVCRMGNEYSHFRVLASPQEHRLFTTDPLERMKEKKQNN